MIAGMDAELKKRYKSCTHPTLLLLHTYMRDCWKQEKNRKQGDLTFESLSSVE